MLNTPPPELATRRRLIVELFKSTCAPPPTALIEPLPTRLIVAFNKPRPPAAVASMMPALVTVRLPRLSAAAALLALIVPPAWLSRRSLLLGPNSTECWPIHPAPEIVLSTLCKVVNTISGAGWIGQH